MARIVFGIIAVVASFILAESLTCNQCSYGLVGFCLSSSEEMCATNTSVCFTGRATFPSISDTLGFNSQGCTEPLACNLTTSGTLLGISFTTQIECCTTDNCNPTEVSGAPSTKMTLTAAIGAAILATMWGSMM